MLRTAVRRMLRKNSVDTKTLLPVHLGVILPQEGLQLIAAEAFQKTPQCKLREKPTEAGWRILKQVVRGPLFADEVLACTATVDGQRFVAVVGVVHINCLMRYDRSLLIPVHSLINSSNTQVAAAIVCMQKLLEQFAEAQRL